MRLLIIEDDLTIAELLLKFFKSNHYIVDLASDGELGLNLASFTNYDLIVMDYLLPKINGQEIINDLRENGNTTPILVISNCLNIKNKINFLESGADDYLTKPFSFTELNARVTAILRRYRKLDDKTLSFADLKLNLSSHEATRAGKNIYLTTKEFFILRLLMERPDIICSKQSITEKVWDDASCHLSNTIEAHILHLRHKIDFKKRFIIKTVPGRGYKIS